MVSGGLSRTVGLYAIAGSSRPESNLDPLVRELPMEEAQSLKLVLELAPRFGYDVEVIDTAGSAEEVASVPREILEVDQYPVLVRPDGPRLVGAEWFTPGYLKRFLAEPVGSASPTSLR